MRYGHSLRMRFTRANLTDKTPVLPGEFIPFLCRLCHVSRKADLNPSKNNPYIKENKNLQPPPSAGGQTRSESHFRTSAVPKTGADT
jgi:hypothetical protein